MITALVYLQHFVHSLSNVNNDTSSYLRSAEYPKLYPIEIGQINRKLINPFQNSRNLPSWAWIYYCWAHGVSWPTRWKESGSLSWTDTYPHGKTVPVAFMKTVSTRNRQTMTYAGQKTLRWRASSKLLNSVCPPGFPRTSQPIRSN